MTVDRDREAEWRQFVMRLDSLPPEEIEAVFARHRVLAVTLADAGDTPILQSAREVPEDGPPLWRDTRITALFRSDLDVESLCADLRRSLGLERLPDHAVETLEDRAWEREWLNGFGPMRFGERLWVCPADTEVDLENAVVVRIDPGLAFGTGTHETTAMCLEWLDGLDLDGASVLDVGCGSGVLAVAALLLGAGSACACDVDPQAVEATRRNARRNNVLESLTVTRNRRRIAGTFDLAVANILAEPLADLAGWICDHLASGGRIALSGILVEQADAVADAYRQWISFDPPTVRNNWARLTGTRI